jgi:hypothetical protein
VKPRNTRAAWSFLGNLVVRIKKAFTKGWLEEVCAHMANKPKNYWTDDRIRGAA